MYALVICDCCDHSIMLHEGDGCTLRACACAETPQTIIDDALDEVKRESLSA
jgi:hypothetical protein